ncbi:MAG: outer membrane lipoprotein carrier protein LolA [Caldimicrobium sp.]|nr:outer membrane lipoprotein carrier protein LolA [Caldimicrobium sp.]
MAFALVLLLLLVNPLEFLQAQEIKEVIEKINNFYQEVQSLRGNFLQETHFKNGQRELRSGKLWIKKPGLFRWEYLTPEKFVIISDSRNLYVYYPEENQAYVYPGGKALSSQLALGFMSGRGDIRRDLRLESFRVLENNFWELTFLPAYQDSQIEKIALKINLDNGEVKEIVLFYYSGERVRLALQNLEYNLNLSNKLFEFQPPKRTKIN